MTEILGLGKKEIRGKRETKERETSKKENRGDRCPKKLTDCVNLDRRIGKIK